MTTAVPSGAKSVLDPWIAAIHDKSAGAPTIMTTDPNQLVPLGRGFQVSSTSKLPSVAALATNQLAVPLTLIPNLSLISYGAACFAFSSTRRAASIAGATA